MNFLDNQNFEEVSFLDKEIGLPQLLGRRMFVQINKYFPNIFTTTEVTNWKEYEINFPKELRLPKIDSIKMELDDTLVKFTFLENVTPIEVRNLTYHILKELQYERT